MSSSRTASAPASVSSPVDFVSNTLSKSSDVAQTYTGILAGYWTYQIQNVGLYNTILQDGATSKITWQGPGTKDIEIGWLLNVTVQNADGSAASGAEVQIVNNSNILVYEGLANANGLLANVPVVTTIYQQTGSDPAVITTTAQGPFSVKATSGTKKGSAGVSLTDEQNLTIVVN